MKDVTKSIVKNVWSPREISFSSVKASLCTIQKSINSQCSVIQRSVIFHWSCLCHTQPASNACLVTLLRYSPVPHSLCLPDCSLPPETFQHSLLPDFLFPTLSVPDSLLPPGNDLSPLFLTNISAFILLIPISPLPAPCLIVCSCYCCSVTDLLPAWTKQSATVFFKPVDCLLRVEYTLELFPVTVMKLRANIRTVISKRYLHTFLKKKKS